MPMKPDAYAPYDPLETLKPFADDVWIADGPEIGMSILGATFPFPTRMTVVRLQSGDLWLHSPIAWSESLASSIAELGPVRHLIAPNTLHYSYLTVWRDHYPDARTYAAPDLARRARIPMTFDETLGAAPPAAWEGALDQCVTRGRVVTEADFFHRASRTLILTDLIENFEPDRVRNPALRWLIRLAGAADPDGKAPIDMRLSFFGRRAEIRRSAQRMLAWEPERIILSHGRCYEANGVAELRRAFRWAL
jgi:hypothetical protein